MDPRALVSQDPPGGRAAAAERLANSATHPGFVGLRVALVGPLAPPAGGMAGQTRQMAELLGHAGAMVLMVQTNRPYRPAWVARLRGLRAAFRLLGYLGALWRAAGRAQLFHVMANSGWAWHLFAAPAIWVAHWRGVPVVVHYHGGEAAPFLARSLRWVRWTMRRARHLVVPSGYLEQIFGQAGMHSRVISNLIDLERFSPVWRPGSVAPHVIVARNLEPIYDNETAVRAFAELLPRWPGARLTIAGSGPDLARLEAVVRELGLATQVVFAGRMDRDQMAALFRCADLCLNPSRQDNMPVSILEAMASGVPVVTTNVGGIPYIAADGRTAVLVDPADPQAMAAAAHRLLSDAPFRSKIVSQALDSVVAYSWPRVSAQWLSVYQDVLASRRPAALA